MMNLIQKHWRRLKRSLGRRWREALLPRGYVKLGTRYGGWWIDTRMIGVEPLLIDCGLGEDISFPQGFLERYPAARVIGVEPNPRSLAYSRTHCPPGMEILPQAFWTQEGEKLTFHLPRSQDRLPEGADGVSGSLINSHEYVNDGELLEVTTTSLTCLMEQAGRERCDILKLDIEGAEYAILDQLVASGELSRIDQLLVEFHHGVTHHTREDTDKAVALLLADGMESIHTEGRNYIFRRTRKRR
jgi:FkbM family methyltransferase